MTSYRYSTWHGYWVQRALDDATWLVHTPAGAVIARTTDWRRAMWFALDAGNAVQTANATNAANASLPAGSDRAAPLPVVEPDGLPAVGDETGTAAWLAGLGNKA